MKTVLINQTGSVTLTNAEQPHALPGYAVVQMKALSICGSDINTYRGTGTKVSYPRIPGHEAAGIISEILPEDAAKYNLTTGTRVVVDPYLHCDHCYPCSLGHTNCCESLQCLGVQTDGTMREYLLHPVSQLLPVDDALPFELVPLSEPLTISLHAIHSVGLSAGEKFAIFGAGPIGLLAAMAAKFAYNAVPILIDVVKERLEFANTLGIEHTIDSKSTNLEQEISRLTDGRMAETVLEASGASIAIANSLNIASYCGRIALTGWPTNDTALATSIITKKELKVYGSRNSKGEFPEALQLISNGTVNARAVLSEIVSFDGLPQAIINIAEKPDKYLKIAALID